MMTDAEKKMQKYTKAIARRLNMPSDVKDRVMTDLISSISSRREAGQTDAEIYAEFGLPKAVAAELNEQMKEFTYTKSPWRWACLALAVLSAIILFFGGILETLTFLFNKAVNSSIGTIGGADGPTAIFVTTSKDAWLYQLSICSLLLAMGLIGFFALRRCPKKENEPQD